MAKGDVNRNIFSVCVSYHKEFAKIQTESESAKY